MSMDKATLQEPALAATTFGRTLVVLFSMDLAVLLFGGLVSTFARDQSDFLLVMFLNAVPVALLIQAGVVLTLNRSWISRLGLAGLSVSLAIMSALAAYGWLLVQLEASSGVGFD